MEVKVNAQSNPAFLDRTIVKYIMGDLDLMDALVIEMMDIKKRWETGELILREANEEFLKIMKKYMDLNTTKDRYEGRNK